MVIGSSDVAEHTSSIKATGAACMKREKERGKRGKVPVTEQSAVGGRPSAGTRAGQGPGKERPPAAGRADLSMKRP